MVRSGEAWRKLNKYCANKEYFKDHTEALFEEDLRDILGMLRVASIHLKEGGEMPMPDLLCFAHPTANCALHAFLIETKRKKTYKLSEIQKASFDLLRDYVRIERVTTWEEAVLFLSSIFPEGGK